MARKRKAQPTAGQIIADAQLEEADVGLFLGPDAETALPVEEAAAETVGGLSAVEHKRMLRVLAELANRRREALRLYEPLPVMERFHADGRKERLLRGGNRAGKTLAAAVEMARALTGCDPFGRYPKADGLAAVVGLDGRHCGDPIYKLLFKPGAFRIIKDEKTGEWRSVRPGVDKDRMHLSRPAPALVPRRLVKEIAWEERKREIPSIVTLTNGWKITFYSSKGSPPNGIQLDLLWIDEEIENEAWWPEMVARLLDRRGRAFWSATPQVASEHLFNLHVRAEAARTDGGPDDVGEHVAILADNPFIDDEEKRLFADRIVSDEERRVRLMGEFALTGFKIYPEFSMSVHGYDLDGPLPADWCRFMIVDPGRQVCAVLFAAVPPPHHPPMLLVYDELYLKGCDADAFGKAAAGKLDHVQPEEFIIDGHAGRITDIGSGRTIEAQYAEALKKYGAQSARTGSGFSWGSDDVKAGILAVHSYLRLQESSGQPLLRVARGRCPKLEYEFVRYHYRKINKQVSDEPEKRNDHLMDTVRYLCSRRPSWVKPRPFRRQKNYAVEYMARKLARKQARSKADGGGGIRLGPGK